MGHDDTRGKGASDSPKPADDLDSAFDSIDDTMKEVARREVTVTPEALEQIVNDAVAKAITAYEQSRGATPEASLPHPTGQRRRRAPAAVPLSPWRAKLERLQGDMGLDEIEFESPRPLRPSLPRPSGTAHCPNRWASTTSSSTIFRGPPLDPPLRTARHRCRDRVDERISGHG